MLRETERSMGWLVGDKKALCPDHSASRQPCSCLCESSSASASSGEPPGGGDPARLPRTQRATAGAAPTKGPVQGCVLPATGSRAGGQRPSLVQSWWNCVPTQAVPAVTELKTETYSPGCHLPPNPWYGT